MNVINRISELGNKFFDWVLKGIIPLPGIVKGVIVIITFALVAIGILSLLKKSFKVFGIILLVLFVAIFVSSFLFK